MHNKFSLTLTEKYSDLYDHELMDRALYLTPGSRNPYWAERANFQNDVAIATPYDFLDSVGYDYFEPIEDSNDESITLKINLEENFYPLDCGCGEVFK
jgi:hypothetical protein